MIKTIKELKLAIDEKMKECNAVVIVPHIGTDCDALASSLAVALIAKKYGRDFVIVMDDEKVESVVGSIMAELPPEIKFVNSKLLEEYLKDKKALYIVVDTNKRELIPIKDIDARDNVIVIDHHDVGESSILTEDKFISLGVSSASEIMFKLLEDMRIKYDSNLQGTELNFNIANYLLAGIFLDTSKFEKNTFSGTMKVVGNLMVKGADLTYVNNLFMEDFESDQLVLNLVRNPYVKLFNIAIALNTEDPKFIYDKEALAKAADFLNKYKSIDAAFAIGLIDKNTTYVSGRSKGDVNIGEIMSQLGGGGNASSGAAKIEKCEDVYQIKLKLDDVIRPGYKFHDMESKKIN